MRSLLSSKVAAAALIAAVCLASLVAALPAGASGAYVVRFEGCTTQLTAVQLIGGTGSYSFSSGACSFPGSAQLGCTAAGTATTASPPVGAGTCDISASGTYVNIVCGTGTTGGGLTVMSDTATASPGNVVGSVDTVGTRYGILFVAGIGLIRGQVTSSNHLPAGSNLAGFAQIIPTGGDCLTGVTTFLATGAAATAG